MNNRSPAKLSRLEIFSIIFVLAFLGISSADEPNTSLNKYAGADTCVVCHEIEHAEWASSPHAKAYSETFQSYWKSGGEKKECLLCHTTGFDTSTGKYAFEGVSCESCHGVFKEGHPDSEKMFLPTDVEVCKSCHENTYREWKLSAHGRKNIRCFDCHQAHKQGLRQASAELHCGSCHAQRFDDFAHATHHFQGLTCTTCHMPTPQGVGKIGGTGAPAHTFYVGVQTCAACHDEMVHKSHKIPTLMGEVVSLTEKADMKFVNELQSKIHSLELDVDVAKSRTLKYSLMALTLGSFLGALMILWSFRGRGGGRGQG